MLCIIVNVLVYFTDATGVNIPIRNLKLTFLDVNWSPPQTTLARVLLNTSVRNTSESTTRTIEIGKHKLEIPSQTAWFEHWRDIFFKVQYPSDHEFSKHFLACILVISSSDSFDMFNSLEQNLNQIQNTLSGKLPKWFNGNVLKYYVVVHDNFEGNLGEYVVMKTFIISFIYFFTVPLNCMKLQKQNMSPKIVFY